VTASLTASFKFYSDPHVAMITKICNSTSNNDIIVHYGKMIGKTPCSTEHNLSCFFKVFVVHRPISEEKQS